jgi:hypothetical protein
MKTDKISSIKKKIRKLSRKTRKNLNLQEEYDRLEEEYDRLEEEYNRLEEEEGEEDDNVNKMILNLKQLQTGRMRRETANMINNNKGKLDQLYKTIIDEIHAEQRRIKTEQHLERRRIKEEQRRIKEKKTHYQTWKRWTEHIY